MLLGFWVDIEKAGTRFVDLRMKRERERERERVR